MSKLQSTGWILGVFTIASFVVVNYTLNHFYVNGAYMMDSGHFAYLSAHAVACRLVIRRLLVAPVFRFTFRRRSTFLLSCTVF